MQKWKLVAAVASNSNFKNDKELKQGFYHAGYCTKKGVNKSYKNILLQWSPSVDLMKTKERLFKLIKSKFRNILIFHL